MKNRIKEILKVAGATALTLTLASATFLGANSIAFAAAVQPETLPKTDDIKASYQIASVPSGDALQAVYKEPNITVIFDEGLDRDGKPYTERVPSANAMSYEEAAKIGARYIWEMYGDKLEGKYFQMSFHAWPHSSRTYWHGNVGNSLEDLNPKVLTEDALKELIANAEPGANIVELPDEYSQKTIYTFSIDAVTGDRVSIHPSHDYPAPTDLGEGTTYNLSPLQMEALQYEAPANVEEYAEVARKFAQKHFNHSSVVSVDFKRIGINQGGLTREEQIEIGEKHSEAYREDKNKPYTFTLYDPGRSITFTVTDDTGREAIIEIYMDTKQVIYLDTSGSDFVPGYQYEGEGGIG